MYSFKDLQKLINTSIAEQDYSCEPYGLYEPVEYVLSLSGKRLRPAMVLMACNLYSDDISSAIYPALGLEVFHNFTLLHDDIMDKAAMRRNQPTVHVKWDENTGILSGDAMMIIASKYIARCPEEYLKKVLEVFNQTALEVCEGQQYDMDFESREAVTVEEYMRMIELKTSVLIAASFKIGAIIGGAPEKDIENLYNFGRNIGLAFQLQDDYLDVYGDPDVFGKKIGGDILSNKKTFLLIKAMELAKGPISVKLNSLLSSTGINPEEKISAVTNIYNQLNIRELSAVKMLGFHKNALKCLEMVKADSGKKSEIRSIADKLLERIN